MIAKRCCLRVLEHWAKGVSPGKMRPREEGPKPKPKPREEGSKLNPNPNPREKGPNPV